MIFKGVKAVPLHTKMEDIFSNLDRLKKYGMGDDAEEFLDRAVFSDAKDADEIFAILDRLKKYGMGDDAEEFLDRAAFSDAGDADEIFAILDRLKEYGMGDDAEEFLDRATFPDAGRDLRHPGQARKVRREEHQCS